MISIIFALCLTRVLGDTSKVLQNSGGILSASNSHDLGQDDQGFLLSTQAECDSVDLRILRMDGSSPVVGSCTVQMFTEGRLVNIVCRNGACPSSCDQRTIIGLLPNSVYTISVSATSFGSTASTSFLTKQRNISPMSFSGVSHSGVTLSLGSQVNPNSATCVYNVVEATTLRNANYFCAPVECNRCDSVTFSGLKPNTQYTASVNFLGGYVCDGSTASFITSAVTVTSQTTSFTRKVHALFTFSYLDEAMVCDLTVRQGLATVFSRRAVGASCRNITVYNVAPNRDYIFSLNSDYFASTFTETVRTRNVVITQQLLPQYTVGSVTIRVTVEPIIEGEPIICAHFFSSAYVVCQDCSHVCQDFTVLITGGGSFTSEIRSPNSDEVSTLLVVPDSVRFTLTSWRPGADNIRANFRASTNVTGTCTIRLEHYLRGPITPVCNTRLCPTDCNNMNIILMSLPLFSDYDIYIDTPFSQSSTPFQLYTDSVDYGITYILEVTPTHILLYTVYNDTDPLLRHRCEYDISARFDRLETFYNNCENITLGNLVPASEYSLGIYPDLSIRSYHYFFLTPMTAPYYLFVHQLAATVTQLDWSSFEQETDLNYMFTVRVYIYLPETNTTRLVLDTTFARDVNSVYAYNLRPRQRYLFEVCTTIIRRGVCPADDYDCDSCLDEDILLDVPPDRNPEAGTILRDENDRILVTWPGAYMQLGIASCHLIVGSLRKTRSKPTYFVNSTEFNVTDLTRVIEGDLWRVHGSFRISDCEGNRYVVLGNNASYGGVVNYPLLADFDISAVFVVCNRTHCLPSEPYDPFVVQTINIPYYVLLAIGTFIWICTFGLALHIMLSSFKAESGVLKLDHRGGGVNSGKNFKLAHVREETNVAFTISHSNEEDFVYSFGNSNASSHTYLFNKSDIANIVAQLKDPNNDLLDKWWNFISNASSYGIGDIAMTVRAMRNKASNNAFAKQLQLHLNNVFPGAKLIGGVENDSEYILSDTPKNETIWSIANIIKQHNIKTVIVFEKDQLVESVDPFTAFMRGEAKLNLPQEIALVHVKNDYNQNIEVNTFSRAYSDSNDMVKFLFFRGWPENGFPDMNDLLNLRKLVQEWQPDQWIPMVISSGLNDDASGIFLALDYNMKRIENSLTTFNVVGILSMIKASRDFALRYKESLVYIHEVLEKISDISEKSVNTFELRDFVRLSLQQEENPLLIDYLKYQINSDEVDIFEVDACLANKSSAITLSHEMPGLEQLDPCVITPAANKCCYIDCKSPNKGNMPAFLTLLKELNPSIIVHLGRKSDYAYYLNKSGLVHEDIKVTFTSPTKVQMSVHHANMQLTSGTTVSNIIVVFCDIIDTITLGNISPDFLSLVKFVSAHLQFSKELNPRVVIHSPIPHVQSAPFIGTLIYMRYAYLDSNKIYYIQVMRSLRKARKLTIPNYANFAIMLNLLQRLL